MIRAIFPFVLFGALLGCATPNTGQDVTPAGPEPTTTQALAAIDVHLRRSLKDPDSVKQFAVVSGPVLITWYRGLLRGGGHERAWMMCFEYNAKNSYGAYVGIKREAIAVGIGWVPAAELDQLGLTAALRLAVERALSDLVRPVEAVMLDGKHNILQGGQWSASASVVAKLARDRYMGMLARLYPEYGFERHVGYGTAAHRAAMEAHGLTPVHRRSYAPVKKLAVVAN